MKLTSDNLEVVHFDEGIDMIKIILSIVALWFFALGMVGFVHTLNQREPVADMLRAQSGAIFAIGGFIGICVIWT